MRLRQGDPAAETAYDADPAAAARRWTEAGAEWLHVVNLDGALEDEAASRPNLEALRAILGSVVVPVQFGGGLRSLDDVARLLDWGVSRVVLGTVAVCEPAVLAAALDRFGPARIVGAIDARGGRVAIRGWRERTAMGALQVGRALRQAGVERTVYTDIARDGTLAGPNLAATRRLARETGLRVIASGGISCLADLVAIAGLEAVGVEGAIVGQALYTGAIDLRQALARLQGEGGS